VFTDPVFADCEDDSEGETADDIHDDVPAVACGARGWLMALGRR
jgi:hypothetical protein